MPTKRKDAMVKLCVRLRPNERQQLIEEAERAGKSISVYVREIIKYRDPDRMNLSEEVIKKIRNLDYEMGKIGVNVNQVAKRCNTRRYVLNADAHELEAELHLLESKFDELLEEMRKRSEDGSVST